MSITKYNLIKGNKKGFTLVEVLVALLVLAFGLLGLAGIQLYGLRQNQTALYRSLATQMAYDIADRIRANPIGFDDGKYNNKAATTDDCLTNSCDPAKMAGFDLAQWNASINDLPLGVGIVCRDSTPTDGTVIGGVLTHACNDTGNIYAVKVWWDERRDPDENAPVYTQFVMSFQQ